MQLSPLGWICFAHRQPDSTSVLSQAVCNLQYVSDFKSMPVQVGCALLSPWDSTSTTGGCDKQLCCAPFSSTPSKHVMAAAFSPSCAYAHAMLYRAAFSSASLGQLQRSKVKQICIQVMFEESE